MIIFIIVFWMLIIILPIIPLVLTSLKIGNEYFSSNSYQLPNSFLHLNNYKSAIVEGKMLLALLNTLILIFFSIAVTTFLSSSAAYATCRFEFKFKNSLSNIYSILALIPLIVIQFNLLKIMNSTNLYNSFLGVNLLYSFLDLMALYLCRDYINKIDVSYDEVALLSGYNYFQIYFKIILPNLLPAILLIGIIKTVVIFNDFYTQFLFLPSKPTVSTALYSFMSTTNINPQVISACVIISLIVSILILLIMQKNIDKYKV